MVRKLLAHMLVMCMCFTGTDIVCAQPTARPTVKVPKEIASVAERIIGKKNGLVIHIQDAHTSFEAQENIAKLIAHLVKTDATRIVSVEGAEGPLDVASLRMFPRSEIRWKAAESMMAYGYLTGAEVAAIGMEQDIAFVGAENIKLYKRNLRKFQAVVSRRADIIKELEELEDAIGNLKAPLYSDEMLKLDAEIAQYYDGKLNFIDFARQILTVAQSRQVDVFEYPNLGLFVESLEQARGNDADKKADIEKDRSSLMLSLLAVVRDENVLRLLQKLTVNADQISEEKQLLLDSFLLKQLRLNGLAETDYMAFVRHAQFAEKFGRIDKEALIDELEQFSVSLLKSCAAGNATAIEHVELSAALRLMKNLIELKVVPEQVAAFEMTAEDYSSVRFMNFLREQSKIHDLNYHPSSRIGVIDEILVIAKEFYRYAEARSKILVDNTIDQMLASGEHAIVLVAGGYHTDGILKEVQKQGYSCMVVSPSITNADLTVPYIERMMNMKSAAELRFESAFNTIVKQSLMDPSNDIDSNIKKLYFTTAAAVCAGMQYLVDDHHVRLPLSQLKRVSYHMTQFLSWVEELQLGEAENVYLVVTGENGTMALHVIFSTKNMEAVVYPRASETDVTAPFVRSITTEEVQALKREGRTVTAAQLYKTLADTMITKGLDIEKIHNRNELLSQIEGMLFGAATGFLTVDELAGSLLSFYGSITASARDQAITSQRLFTASNAMAVLSVETIKAIGAGDLDRGAHALAGMVRHDAAYAAGYNDLFGQLIGTGDHAVLVICDTDEEKTRINDVLNAAGTQEKYTVKVATKIELMKELGQTVRPGRGEIADVTLGEMIDVLIAKNVSEKSARIVVGTVRGEGNVTVDNKRVFAFDPEALTTYVGGDAAVRLNLVDALLVAGQHPDINVVSMVFDQLLNLRGRIIEHLAAAFEKIKNDPIFTTAA